MNTKKLLIGLCILSISSCGFWSSKRKPAQVDNAKNLIEKSQVIIDSVATRNLNPENCKAQMGTLITDYSEAQRTIDIDMVKAEGQDILDKSFEARMALRSILGVLPRECKVQMKELFLKMRLVDDLVGAYFYNTPQISAGSLKYQSEPTPIYEADKYSPFHVGAGIDSTKKFEFKNGDIMITKGVSFISSTISELASPKSIYSHIVFVHVDEASKKVSTIESYVGIGVSIYPIEEALKNENARILVLRSKNPELASKAANYMYDRVMKSKKDKKVIYYDYNLDFSDNSTMSCEEVAYDAYKHASNGQFIIPEIESEILLNDDAFLKRVGVKKGSMMVPTDMETDSRFDVVLDWTDYRVIRDSWRKDALLGEMFHWIQNYNYKIYENLSSRAAKLIWSTRYIPGVWQILSKLSGIPSNFTKEVPSLSISTIASLKAIGNDLLAVATKADQDSFEKQGRWLTKAELSETLDKYRQTNPKKLRKVFREK
jgi:hypothetical protein